MTRASEVKIDPRYQLLPEMDSDSFKQLKAGIREHGYQPEFPIIVVEDDVLIDGKNRLRACLELETEPVFAQKLGLTDREKFDLAWGANVPRRHLTPTQRRELIGLRLKMYPEASNRSVAKDVGGDHKTVATQRRQLEETGEIPHFESEGGRGHTQGKQVNPLTDWPRCDVCDSPSDPKKAITSDDGRTGHRKCVEPGVGTDVAHHQAALTLAGTLRYPVESDKIHMRDGLPYPREKEWKELPIHLVIPGEAPTNAQECQTLGVQMGNRLARAMHEGLLTITDRQR